MREDLAQTGSGTTDEIVEERVGGAVAVAEERERRGPVGRWDPVDADVLAGFRGQDDESGEVQAVEAAERHERVLRIRHAGLVIHRREQGAQARLPSIGDRRHDHEARLRRHAAHPLFGGLRAGTV